MEKELGQTDTCSLSYKRFNVTGEQLSRGLAWECQSAQVCLALDQECQSAQVCLALDQEWVGMEDGVD